MDPQTNLYLQYYHAQQSGGQLNVFAGSRRANQSGGSLGGILSGIFRTALPVAARGGATFLSEMLKSHDRGKGWMQSMKEAFGPAIRDAAESTVTNVAKAVAEGGGTGGQGGSGIGKKRKKRGGAKRTGKKRKSPYKAPVGSSERIKFLNF